MTGTIFLILLATSIGIYQDTNKPTEYELTMEDGSSTYVVLQNNNKYACPLHCGIEHIHQAVIYKNKNQINNKFIYHITEKNEYGISLFCSTKKILAMSRLAPKPVAEDLPEVVSATIDE